MLAPLHPEPLEALAAHEILAAVQEPFLVLDGELRVVSANSAFCAEFGLSADEPAGRRVYELRPELRSTALRELLEEVAPGREMVEQHPLVLSPGSDDERHFLATVRPVRSGANRLDLVLVSLRPISPELAGRTGDAPGARRVLPDHSSDVVALYQPDGTCSYVGRGCEKVLGYAPATWMQLRPCDVVHPEDQAVLFASVRSAGDQPDGLAPVARVRRPNGEFAWLEVSARTMVDESGRGLIHATIRDVTQRKRAEEALRWLSRQTRLILDSAGEGIFGVDAAGVVTFVNPAAARLLGAAPGELMGRTHREFTGADAGSEISGTLADGMVRASGGYHFRRAGGGLLPVEYTCTPARQGGRVVGAVVTFRDVSERLRSAAALRRSEWLAGMGQLMLTLRHEINNPLTALLAGVQLLQMGDNTAEEERAMVEAIGVEARRIQEVVRQFTEQPPDSPPEPGRGGS